MAEVTVKFEIPNLKKIQEAFARATVNAQKKLIRKAVKAGGKVLEDEVRLQARKHRRSQPKHPEYGHLDEQIGLRIDVKDTWAAARINTGDAFWGKYLEYGTAKMKAQPFMRPALDYKGEEAFNVAAETITNNLSDLFD